MFYLNCMLLVCTVFAPCMVPAFAAAHACDVVGLILQLSMDRVQVFPDGELNVQAITTAGSSAAFARPVTKGKPR